MDNHFSRQSYHDLGMNPFLRNLNASNKTSPKSHFILNPKPPDFSEQRSQSRSKKNSITRQFTRETSLSFRDNIKSFPERQQPEVVAQETAAFSYSRLIIFLLILAAIFVGFKYQSESGIPYCLLQFKVIECIPCPKNAVCYDDFNFKCLPGFISSGGRCLQDKDLLQNALSIAETIGQEFKTGCRVRETLQNISVEIATRGATQLQIKKALDFLQSKSFQRRYGINELHQGDDIILQSSSQQSTGLCLQWPRQTEVGLGIMALTIIIIIVSRLR